MMPCWADAICQISSNPMVCGCRIRFLWREAVKFAGLALRYPSRTRAGPRGERIPFRPSHATLLISHPDKNKGGVVAACFRPDKYGRRAICIPDDCLICHYEVPIEPGAVLRRFDGDRLPRRKCGSSDRDRKASVVCWDRIRGCLASDRLSDRGGSAMLSVTDNSRGRAVIPGHIVPLRQIARLKGK